VHVSAAEGAVKDMRHHEIADRQMAWSAPAVDLASDSDRVAAPALHLWHQPARVQDAGVLRRVVTDWARERALPEALIADLELAVYEALVNACEHAYPAGVTGTLDLSTHGDEQTVRVIVTDHGRWRPQTAADPLRGRGLPLIRLLSDPAEVTSTSQGTVVIMTWWLTGDRTDSQPGPA
jgi:serine/threonine-protein kinase RsbW